MKFPVFAVSALFGLFIGSAFAAPKDVDGDGKSDVLWLFDGPFSLHLWKMSGSSYTGQVLVGGVSSSPMAIGDLDGDGRAEIVTFEWGGFRNNHKVWVSRVNAAGVLETHLLGTMDLHSGPVGFGDLNGDGHKDILWATTGGGIVAWLVAWNGSSFSYTARDLGMSTATGAGGIRGVADINGDGIDDIIWISYEPPLFSHASVYAWLMTPAGEVGSVLPIGAVAYPWTIRKVADFDGDGKADILWQYSTLNVVWYLDGAGVASVNYLPDVATDWKIIDFGDYNGDGRTDILWELPEGGDPKFPTIGRHVYQWLMSGRGFDPTIPGAVNWITQVAPGWRAALTVQLTDAVGPLP